MPYVPSDDEKAAMRAEMETPKFHAEIAVLDAARAARGDPARIGEIEAAVEALRREDALDVLRRAAAAAGVNVEEMEAAASGDVVPPDEYEAQRQEAAAAARAARNTACADCGGRVKHDDRNVLREITGWAATREQGGTNHVISRTETGRVMCGDCAIRLKAGIAPAQEALL